MPLFLHEKMYLLKGMILQTFSKNVNIFVQINEELKSIEAGDRY